MQIDLKKILRAAKGRSSALGLESVVSAALYALAAVFVLMLFLDGFIFYQYSYRVINESYGSDYLIEIKKKMLDDFAATLKERQEKFNQVKQSPPVYPDPFR